MRYATRIKAGKKALILTCVLCFIGLDLAILLSKILMFDVLVGWDSPVYVQLVRLIQQKGVAGLLAEAYYPHLYSIMSFGVNELLVHDVFVTEKLLPIVLNVAIVMLSMYVMQRMFRNYKLSLLTGFFTLTSVNLVRMTADLRRNLLGFLFFLSLLMLAYEIHRKPSKKKYFSLVGLWVVLIATHIETALFFLLIFLVYEILVLRLFHSGYRALLLNASALLIPLALVIILVFQNSLKFITWWFSALPNPFQTSTLTIGAVFYYLKLLGGVNIPLVFLGVFKCIRLAKNRETNGLLIITYASTSFFVAFVLLGLSERSLLFFPSGILATLGVSSLSRYLPLFQTGSKMSRHVFSPSKRQFKLLAILFLGATLAWLNVITVNVSAGEYLRPFIDEKTYQDLRWLERQGFHEKPIFVITYPNVVWSVGVLQLYRDWIKATVGPNYVYLGKTYYLLHKYKAVFSNNLLEDFSSKTWNELMQDEVLNELDAHPVITLEEFSRLALTPYEQALYDEIWPDVYKLKENYARLSSDMYSIRLISYLDASSSNQYWYIAEKSWATTRQTLEVYDVNPDQNFYVSYKVLLFSNVNYQIKLRLLDANSKFAPVQVVFDDVTLYPIEYKGTEKAVEVTVPLGTVSSAFHDITLRIRDLTRPHMLSLDYVDVVASW